MSQYNQIGLCNLPEKIMGILSTSDDLIRVYLNSEKMNDREALNYLKANEKHILVIDTALQDVSELYWHEILKNLDNDLSQILDQTHQVLEENEVKDYTIEDWVTIIKQNPEIMMGIVVVGKKNTKHFKTPKEVVEHIAGRADSTYQKRS
ncbi:hypothetical protein KIM67_17835 [Flagellimonas sp. 389]|uniref:hypothetical protein n=1 Tax=Flagellimonas sp. 389 TaxID=2835862 RepID=UPI001BD6DFAF|nr:hypothetical protein [Flagellimonas sp. 389]MBS9464289.1 hypothetical protein [Flagellimonas sp. 389]